MVYRSLRVTHPEAHVYVEVDGWAVEPSGLPGMGVRLGVNRQGGDEEGAAPASSPKRRSLQQQQQQTALPGRRASMGGGGGALATAVRGGDAEPVQQRRRLQQDGSPYQVSTTQAWPNNAIVLVELSVDATSNVTCSGTWVSGYDVLLAAHCLRDVISKVSMGSNPVVSTHARAAARSWLSTIQARRGGGGGGIVFALHPSLDSGCMSVHSHCAEQRY